MHCTRLITNYCFEGSPVIAWEPVWHELASLVEAIIQPNPSSEQLWWMITPAPSVAPDNLVLNGHVELCAERPLPRAACATLSQSFLYGLQAVSERPVIIEIEFSSTEEIVFKRPCADSTEAAAEKIATLLR